jgi:CheY-like chemotaxis protein
MKQNGTIAQNEPIPLNILLADDDADDRYFFEKVLKALPILTRLATVNDGEKLMTYLFENSEKLPDVLFLDLNMPRKNGSECLLEIKHNEKLKHLPVIIYSTHMHEKDAELLYRKGAHYYIRKTDMIELAKALHYVLDLMIEDKFIQPAKDKFVFATQRI